MGLITKGVGNQILTLGHGEHHIHEGHAFTTLDSVALGSGDTYDFLMVMPDAPPVSFTYALDFALEGSLAVYIGDEYTGGTPVGLYNRNFMSSKTSGVLCVSDPTITTPGALLSTATYGSRQRAGGLTRNEEFILLPEMVLRFRITSNTAANNIAMRWNFIEDPDIYYDS